VREGGVRPLAESETSSSERRKGVREREGERRINFFEVDAVSGLTLQR